MILFQRKLSALIIYGLLICSVASIKVYGQQNSQPLPPASTSNSPPRATLISIEQEIELQRARLASIDEEERRNAVLRLGSFARPDASRVASIALADRRPRVRVVAVRAVLALPAEEVAALLIPFLQRRRERDEFVRREAAYALGETKSRSATLPLIGALEEDSTAGVRGAAAVALGMIEDERAVPVLVETLSRRVRASGFLNRLRRRRSEENEFVRRSAARALGQMRSQSSVPALIAVLGNEQAGDDVRREAARSLDSIGDRAAIPALRSVLTARDPYLARIAFEALRKFDSANLAP